MSDLAISLLMWAVAIGCFCVGFAWGDIYGERRMTRFWHKQFDAYRQDHEAREIERLTKIRDAAREEMLRVTKPPPPQRMDMLFGFTKNGRIH